MEDVVEKVKDRIISEGINFHKVIIYCQYYREVAEIYQLFKKVLGIKFTHPEGFLDLPEYRLVDMYTGATEPSGQEKIVQYFSQPDGNLHVVIATVAFGMGLDCPNVQQILYWGPAEDIEAYVQAIGHARRDGSLCHAHLMYCPSDQQHTAKSMMIYCKNTTSCRILECSKILIILIN